MAKDFDITAYANRIGQNLSQQNFARQSGRGHSAMGGRMDQYILAAQQSAAANSRVSNNQRSAASPASRAVSDQRSRQQSNADQLARNERNEAQRRAEVNEGRVRDLTVGRMDDVLNDEMLGESQQFYRDTLSGAGGPYSEEVQGMLRTQASDQSAMAEQVQREMLQEQAARTGAFDINDPSSQAAQRGMTANRQRSNQQANTNIGLQSAIENFRAQQQAAAGLTGSRMGQLGHADMLGGRATDFYANQVFNAQEALRPIDRPEQITYNAGQQRSNTPIRGGNIDPRFTNANSNSTATPAASTPGIATPARTPARDLNAEWYARHGGKNNRQRGSGLARNADGSVMTSAGRAVGDFRTGQRTRNITIGEAPMAGPQGINRGVGQLTPIKRPDQYLPNQPRAGQPARIIG